MNANFQPHGAGRPTVTRARRQERHPATAVTPTALAGHDEALPCDDVGREAPVFSTELMRDLSAHRTAALQAALMRHPRIALVTLVHRMAETVFGLYGAGNNIVKVTVQTTGDATLSQDASCLAASRAGLLLESMAADWLDHRLPVLPSALFPWLLSQPERVLLELLAYCTARSVNVIDARPRAFDHGDALAEALGLDMADWWKPTAATYLDSVSLPQALEAVEEATGIDATKATAGMTKAAAMAYCASKLDGTRWLPEPLRAKFRSGPVRATADDIAPDR